MEGMPERMCWPRIATKSMAGKWYGERTLPSVSTVAMSPRVVVSVAAATSAITFHCSNDPSRISSTVACNRVRSTRIREMRTPSRKVRSGWTSFLNPILLRRTRRGAAIITTHLPHVVDDGADREAFLNVAGDAVPGIHVAEGRALPSPNEHGQVRLGCGDHPCALRIDLVRVPDRAVAQDLVHELVP